MVLYRCAKNINFGLPVFVAVRKSCPPPCQFSLVDFPMLEDLDSIHLSLVVDLRVCLRIVFYKGLHLDDGLRLPALPDAKVIYTILHLLCVGGLGWMKPTRLGKPASHNLLAGFGLSRLIRLGLCCTSSSLVMRREAHLLQVALSIASTKLQVQSSAVDCLTLSHPLTSFPSGGGGQHKRCSMPMHASGLAEACGGRPGRRTWNHGKKSVL